MIFRVIGFWTWTDGSSIPPVGGTADGGLFGYPLAFISVEQVTIGEGILK